MRAYVGQTRDPALVEKLKEHDIGECTVRGELLSRKRDPWFYDNGAYRDWKAGHEFNSMRFQRDMRRIRIDREFGDTKRMARCGRKLETYCGAPDFIVAPDIVAGGMESLKFSCSWTHDLEDLPCYLAVQDGMKPTTVARALKAQDQPFAGIFVGGRLEWKLETSPAWVKFAHDTGRRCHIGRVGTPDRARWARTINADSIDSCLPIMHAEHLGPWLIAVAEAR